MEVTALKALLEEASGVPASRQRLICRGRVLQDTQRISDLRVADGDTLHMVQRPPDVQGMEGLYNEIHFSFQLVLSNLSDLSTLQDGDTLSGDRYTQRFNLSTLEWGRLER